MPGSPAHLVQRFFDVLFARALTGAEREDVTDVLGPELATLFFAQSKADQRHGYHAACTVRAAGVQSKDVVIAATMHDIGKRHARLGVIGRVLASLMILLRLPLPSRFAAYRDHGVVGAKELADVGAPGIAIDFALHHHGERPRSIDEDTWRILVAADQPPKPSSVSRRRITSADT